MKFNEHWTAEELRILKEMAESGFRAREIAARLGKTRNAVIGRAYRGLIFFKINEGTVDRTYEYRRERAIAARRARRARLAATIARIGEKVS